MPLNTRSILLVIGGGIAAYKSLELIRLLRKDGAQVTAILTNGGQKFITPLAVSSLTGRTTYTDLWSLTDETEMGHIRLAREADLIIVAPATANMMARLAAGMADDLAATCLLAATVPVLLAPAMNPAMWANAATRANHQCLLARGFQCIGPEAGDMACGEEGVGRMSEPAAILEAVRHFFGPRPLAGLKALVTSGPTLEAIDPVRFIGNRSSGKMGHALAEALQHAGADVTLVTGPVAIPMPWGVRGVPVTTAQEMLGAVQKSMPVDIAICAAAVADWRADPVAPAKIKKTADGVGPVLPPFVQTTDILEWIGRKASPRPRRIVGFAAESENMVQHARQKLTRKGCDWIVANDIAGATTPFGSDTNSVTLLTGADSSPIVIGPMTKKALAGELVSRLVSDLINE